MSPLEIWQALGGVGYPPGCLGSEAGTVLVVGDARGVWDDVARFADLFGRGTHPILCVGQAGMYWPSTRSDDPWGGRTLDYWANLHTEAVLWDYWFQARLNGHDDAGRVQTIAPPHGHPPRTKNVLPIGETFAPGGSGLYGVLCALMLGFDQVVLAGIPLDNSGRFHEPPYLTTPYGDDAEVTLAWQTAIRRFFTGRVTSLSGQTREWLGTPMAPAEAGQIERRVDV